MPNPLGLSFSRKTLFSVHSFRTLMFCYLSFLILSSYKCSAYYVNEFAVHIKGGVVQANKIAKEFGFTNQGQVSMFTLLSPNAFVFIAFYLKQSLELILHSNVLSLAWFLKSLCWCLTCISFFTVKKCSHTCKS